MFSVGASSGLSHEGIKGRLVCYGHLPMHVCLLAEYAARHETVQGRNLEGAYPIEEPAVVASVFIGALAPVDIPSAGLTYLLLMAVERQVIQLGGIEQVEVPDAYLVHFKALFQPHPLNDVCQAENAMIEVEGRVIGYHSLSS